MRRIRITHPPPPYRAWLDENRGTPSYTNGAPIKAQWYEPELLLTPLDEDCERRFRFAWSETIKACPSDHPKARETTSRLRLEHPELTKLREAAVRSFLFVDKRIPLDNAQAKRLFEGIDRPHSDGRLRPSCFVLKQLLERIVDRSGEA